MRGFSLTNSLSRNLGDSLSHSLCISESDLGFDARIDSRWKSVSLFGLGIWTSSSASSRAPKPIGDGGSDGSGGESFQSFSCSALSVVSRAREIPTIPLWLDLTLRICLSFSGFVSWSVSLLIEDGTDEDRRSSSLLLDHQNLWRCLGVVDVLISRKSQNKDWAESSQSLLVHLLRKDSDFSRFCWHLISLILLKKKLRKTSRLQLKRSIRHLQIGSRGVHSMSSRITESKASVLHFPGVLITKSKLSVWFPLFYFGKECY